VGFGWAFAGGRSSSAADTGGEAGLLAGAAGVARSARGAQHLVAVIVGCADVVDFVGAYPVGINADAGGVDLAAVGVAE
jgi:hypothetical protein